MFRSLIALFLIVSPLSAESSLTPLKSDFRDWTLRDETMIKARLARIDDLPDPATPEVTNVHAVFIFEDQSAKRYPVDSLCETDKAEVLRLRAELLKTKEGADGMKDDLDDEFEELLRRQKEEMERVFPLPVVPVKPPTPEDSGPAKTIHRGKKFTIEDYDYRQGGSLERSALYFLPKNWKLPRKELEAGYRKPGPDDYYLTFEPSVASHLVWLAQNGQINLTDSTQKTKLWNNARNAIYSSDFDDLSEPGDQLMQLCENIKIKAERISVHRSLKATAENLKATACEGNFVTVWLRGDDVSFPGTMAVRTSFPVSVLRIEGDEAVVAYNGEETELVISDNAGRLTLTPRKSDRSPLAKALFGKKGETLLVQWIDCISFDFP